MDKVEGLYDELMQSFADPYVNALTLRAASEIARLEDMISPPSPDAEALAGRLEIIAKAIDIVLSPDCETPCIGVALRDAKDLRQAIALIRWRGM